MGFFDDVFGDKKKAGGDKKNNNNNNNNNPLANMRKNIERTMNGGKPRMSGPGLTLGGSKPGTVYEIVLDRPGPVGIRVEKRSNNSASAIVNAVVPGSQAETAGLQRGDVLCFAGSNGQDEMPYEMFLEIARSPHRPIREYSTTTTTHSAHRKQINLTNPFFFLCKTDPVNTQHLFLFDADIPYRKNQSRYYAKLFLVSLFWFDAHIPHLKKPIPMLRILQTWRPDGSTRAAPPRHRGPLMPRPAAGR